MSLKSSKLELIPFQNERNNTELHSRYLSWLKDPEVLDSLAVPSLMNEWPEDFLDQAFARFTSSTCHGFLSITD
jgi:hypothetical protein